MTDFKILAIKTGEKENNIFINKNGTEENFLKIIKPNTLYKFYNDYEFKTMVYKKKEIIVKIEYDGSRAPNNLYKIGPKKENISVNISAIVGKNGSGKSSLIELMIRAINNLSIYFNINTDADLKPVYNLDLELYFHSDSFYKISLKKIVTIYKQDSIDSVFRKIKKTDFNFRDFFYSIVVNYSHYGLNSNEIGDWINSLFHKNDGYQIPIVINPMRTNGNIDINTENSLVKSRLIANLLSPSSNKANNNLMVTNNLFAQSIKLKLKQEKNTIIYEIKTLNVTNRKGGQISKAQTAPVQFSDLDIDHNDILNQVNEVYNFGYIKKWETGNHVLDLAHRYIIIKLVKIATTYTFYQKYFDSKARRFDNKKFHEFIQLLLNKNQNHISFKLIQTLNLLKYKHISVVSNKVFYLEISTFSKKIDNIIKNHGLDKDSIIGLVPPPIFEVDIVMKPISGKNESVYFNTLSSGERQLIYSVNSILYHLINLDSIRNSHIQKGYRFINIILEEIELYFHPDMQREFIDFFLRRISELNFKNIRSLNVCLVTHSPFILSDIPNSNILFLDEDGSPKRDAINFRTFGANIHDLLKHSFFLQNGAMGKFSASKITDTIHFINYFKLEQELVKLKKNDANFFKIKKIEAEVLKSKIKEFDVSNHKKLIEMIGEPILQIKLLEMFDETFNKKTGVEIVEKQILELQELALKLKSK